MRPLLSEMYTLPLQPPNLSPWREKSYLGTKPNTVILSVSVSMSKPVVCFRVRVSVCVRVSLALPLIAVSITIGYCP